MITPLATLRKALFDMKFRTSTNRSVWAGTVAAHLPSEHLCSKWLPIRQWYDSTNVKYISDMAQILKIVVSKILANPDCVRNLIEQVEIWQKWQSIWTTSLPPHLRAIPETLTAVDKYLQENFTHYPKGYPMYVQCCFPSYLTPQFTPYFCLIQYQCQSPRRTFSSPKPVPKITTQHVDQLLDAAA